jgi:hypothetical protein
MEDKDSPMNCKKTNPECGIKDVINDIVYVSANPTRLSSNRLLQPRKIIVPGLAVNDESSIVAVRYLKTLLHNCDFRV